MVEWLWNDALTRLAGYSSRDWMLVFVGFIFGICVANILAGVGKGEPKRIRLNDTD
jgi:hypothetical protein